MRGLIVKKKRIALVVWILSITLLLSGCVRFRREVEFHRNGTISCEVNLAVTDEYVQMAGESSKEFLESRFIGIKNFMTIESYDEVIGKDKLSGVRGKCTLPKSMTETAFSTILGAANQVTITKKGFFVKTIQIDVERPATDKSEFLGELAGIAASMVKDAVNDEFRIRVPYAVADTNGKRDAIDPRTVSWDLYDFDTGGTDSCTMTVSYIDWGVIIICIIGVVVLLHIIGGIITIVNVTKAKRRRRALADNNM